jgi:hypothetical protein
MPLDTQGRLIEPIKVDGWLTKFLKLKRRQLEDIGVTSFEPLGCGHYGCVLPHADPKWVVKVTRDPTEGPIAAKVTEMRNKGDAALKGIVLFKEIYKADEIIDWRSKKWPVYVTVRESIKPFSMQDATKMRRYRVEASPTDRFNPYGATAIEAMKEAALKWHELKTEWKKDKAMQDYIAAASRVGDEFNDLGETLFEMLDAGLVLRDVHWANLGYTTWESDNDSDYLWRPAGTVVIHDLGHTPTDPIEAHFKPLGEED